MGDHTPVQEFDENSIGQLFETLEDGNAFVIGGPTVGKTETIAARDGCRTVTSLGEIRDAVSAALVVCDDFYLLCREYHRTDDATAKASFESLLAREAGVCLLARPRELDWLLAQDEIPGLDPGQVLDRFPPVVYRFDAERATAKCAGEYNVEVSDAQRLEPLRYEYSFETAALAEDIDEYETYLPYIVPHLPEYTDTGPLLPDSVEAFVEESIDSETVSDVIARLDSAGSQLVRRSRDLIGTSPDQLERIASFTSYFPAPVSMVGAPIFLWLILNGHDSPDDINTFFGGILDESLPPHTSAQLEDSLGLPPRLIEGLSMALRTDDFEQLQSIAESLQSDDSTIVSALREETALDPDHEAACAAEFAAFEGNLEELRSDVERLDALISPGLENALQNWNALEASLQADESQYSGLATSVTDIPLFGQEKVTEILELEPSVPVLILRGPHGTGKTTTAAKVCRQLEREGARVRIPNLQEEPFRFVKHRLAADTSQPTVLFTVFEIGDLPTVSGDDLTNLFSLVEEGVCETVLIECRDELYPQLESSARTAGTKRRTVWDDAKEVSFSRVSDAAIDELVTWMVEHGDHDIDASALQSEVKEIAAGNPEIAKIATRLRLEGEEFDDIETQDELILYDIRDILAEDHARGKQQRLVFEHLAVANQLTSSQLEAALNLTRSQLVECRDDLSGYLGGSIKDAQPLTGEEVWQISPDIYADVTFRTVVLRDDRLEHCLSNLLTGLDEAAYLDALADVATNLTIAFDEATAQDDATMQADIIENAAALIDTVRAHDDRAAYATCLTTLIEGHIPIPLEQFDVDMLREGLAERSDDETPARISALALFFTGTLTANHILVENESQARALFDQIPAFESTYDRVVESGEPEVAWRRALATAYTGMLGQLAGGAAPAAVEDWIDRVTTRLHDAAPPRGDPLPIEEEFEGTIDGDAADIETFRELTRDDSQYYLNAYSVLCERLIRAEPSSASEWLETAVEHFLEALADSIDARNEIALVELLNLVGWVLVHQGPPEELFGHFETFRELFRHRISERDQEERLLQVFYRGILSWVFPPDDSSTYMQGDFWVVQGRVSEARRKAWYEALIEDARTIFAAYDSNSLSFLKLLAYLGTEEVSEADATAVSSLGKPDGALDVVYSTHFRTIPSDEAGARDTLLLTNYLLESVCANQRPSELVAETEDAIQNVFEMEYYDDQPEARQEVIQSLVTESPAGWYYGLATHINRGEELLGESPGFRLHFHLLAIVLAAHHWPPQEARAWLDAVTADAVFYASSTADEREYLALLFGATAWVLTHSTGIEQKPAWLCELEVRTAAVGRRIDDSQVEDLALQAARYPHLDGPISAAFFDQVRDIWGHYQLGGIVDSRAAILQLVSDCSSEMASVWFDFLADRMVEILQEENEPLPPGLFQDLFTAAVTGFQPEKAGWFAELESTAAKIAAARDDDQMWQLDFYLEGVAASAPQLPTETGQAWLDYIESHMDELPVDGAEEIDSDEYLYANVFGTLLGEMALSWSPAECDPWIAELEQRVASKMKDSSGLLQSLKERLTSELSTEPLGAPVQEFYSDQDLKSFWHASFYAIPLVEIMENGSEEDLEPWFDAIEARVQETGAEYDSRLEFTTAFYESIVMKVAGLTDYEQAADWVDVVERRARTFLTDKDEEARVDFWSKFYNSIGSTFLGFEEEDRRETWLEDLLQRVEATADDDLGEPVFFIATVAGLTIGAEFRETPVSMRYFEDQVQRLTAARDDGLSLLAEYYAYLTAASSELPAVNSTEWQKDIEQRARMAATETGNTTRFLTLYYARWLAYEWVELASQDRMEFLEDFRNRFDEAVPSGRTADQISQFYAEAVIGIAQIEPVDEVRDGIDQLLDSAAASLTDQRMNSVYRHIAEDFSREDVYHWRWTAWLLRKGQAISRAISAPDDDMERQQLLATLIEAAIETISKAPAEDQESLIKTVETRLQEVEQLSQDLVAESVSKVPDEVISTVPDELAAELQIDQ